MNYLCVMWKHSNPDYPTLLYSELNADQWEVRKVEKYADGRIGYASELESTEDCKLGIEPIPSLPEIAADPQFVPAQITKDEFEKVWALRATK